jgi:DNA mismatch repair ATPase MutL
MKFSILACIKGKVSSSTVHQAKQKPRKHSEDTKGDSQSEKRKSTSSKHSRTPSASSEKSSKTSKEKSKDSKKEMRPTSSSPSPPPSTRSSKVSKDPKGKKLKPKRTYKYLSEIQSDNTGKQAEEAGPELVLISEINRGAFGTVWKAKYNGHTVAVKKVG